FSLFLFLMSPPPLRSPLFPYTTLFRSERAVVFLPIRTHEKLRIERTERGLHAGPRIGFRYRRIECGPRRRRGAHHRAAQVAHHRSEEHTSELQSLAYLVCRLLLEKKKK